MQRGLSCIQGSSQSKVERPFFTFTILFATYICLILRRSGQTGKSSSLCLIAPITLPPFIYFALIIVCPMPPSFSCFHHHLHNRLMFIFLIFFIPRPPFFLLLHLIRWYFFFFQTDTLPKKSSSLLIQGLGDCFWQQVHRHEINKGAGKA